MRSTQPSATCTGNHVRLACGVRVLAHTDSMLYTYDAFSVLCPATVKWFVARRRGVNIILRTVWAREVRQYGATNSEEVQRVLRALGGVRDAWGCLVRGVMPPAFSISEAPGS